LKAKEKIKARARIWVSSIKEGRKKRGNARKKHKTQK